MRVNPLAKVSPEFRAKLKEEREQARGDTRLKARFLSYRLNCPTADETRMLLEVDDYQRMLERPTPERRGPADHFPGPRRGGRAWSAAVAVWQTGRIESLALAPGDT